MHSLCKYIYLFFAACVLSSCEQKRDEPVIEISSKPTESFEGFVRDTSAYALVIDTTVRDSVFNEKIIHVKRGGFVEYFANEAEKKGTNGKKIFYAYSDSVNPFVKGYSEKPTFIDLVALAYAKHYAMEINPDDIWLMILDGFRLHVKSNRDALKDRFVAPGTDTVVSVMDNSLTLESTHKEWFYTLSELFDSLQAKLPLETGTPLRTKFSTTSPVDANISRTMTMAVASEYYSYNVYTLCGIPKIKVNGTKLDWSLLKDSFNKLASRLDLEWWAKELNPVLDEFINIFDGKINLSHWKNIYKYVESDDCGTDPVNGWITKFYPYIGRDNLERRTDWNEGVDYYDVPMGLTDVDVNWIYYGKKIPLKIYTGFVGIQVDTTRNMLKASRGYALMSYCGWCDMKSIAKNIKYIPGKPLRLHESLAISDSIDVYNAQGLAYATNNPKEIENFAIASSFKKETDESYDTYEIKEKIADSEPICVINLYKSGKIIEHLSLYKQLNKKYVVLLQNIGVLNDSLSLETFLKERHVSLDEFNEFTNDKSIPKLDVEVFVDSFEHKDGNVIGGEFYYKFKRPDFDGAFVWLLKKAFYKHYKKDFNLSVDAKLVYGENGQVVNVIMNTKHPKYKAFLEDVKDALYYVWDSPKIDNDGVGDFIIKSMKLHLSFSRKYRMACKQNGQPAKDSVEFVGGGKCTKGSLQ